MKLLLTSEGIANKSIANALERLVEKPFSQTNIVFIPTALNIGGTNKAWHINHLNNFLQLHPAALDIVDFSAVPQADWYPRIDRGDMLVFEGGNSFHLMYCIEKLGLQSFFEKWLKSKVYIGISAGSVVMTKDLALGNQEKREYAEKIGEHVGSKALGFVDFYVRPHFNNPKFPHASYEAIQKIAQNLSEPIYAIDDQSAIVIQDNQLEVVSEGKWEKFN